MVGGEGGLRGISLKEWGGLVFGGHLVGRARGDERMMVVRIERREEDGRRRPSKADAHIFRSTSLLGKLFTML